MREPQETRRLTAFCSHLTSRAANTTAVDWRSVQTDTFTLAYGSGAHGVGKAVKWSAFDVPGEQLYWDRLAQDVTSLFGSILRIDVDGGFPGYDVPQTNPFVGRDGRDEVYAWSFRNPFASPLMQTAAAIYLSPLSPKRCGRRFIWLLDPVILAGHCVKAHIAWIARHRARHLRIATPAAVVGGRIYRGTMLPELRGKLVFADWSAAFERPSGQLFLATPARRWRETWDIEKLLELDTRILSVAADAKEELYLLTSDELGPFGTSGKIFKLIP